MHDVHESNHSMVFWTIGIVLLYNVTRAGLPDLQLKNRGGLHEEELHFTVRGFIVNACGARGVLGRGDGIQTEAE